MSEFVSYWANVGEFSGQNPIRGKGGAICQCLLDCYGPVSPVLRILPLIKTLLTVL